MMDWKGKRLAHEIDSQSLYGIECESDESCNFLEDDEEKKLTLKIFQGY